MSGIESMLNHNLVKIEDNWSRTNRSVRGRIARMGRRSFVLGFETENEELTLTFTKDGRVLLGNDDVSRHNIDFEGPEEHLLAMLAEGGDLQSIPDSIRVRIGGREFPAGLEQGIGVAARNTAAKKLRSLLK